MRALTAALLVLASACHTTHRPAASPTPPSPSPVVSPAPSPTPSPTPTVVPVTVDVTTRHGGTAALRWQAQYPTFTGLAPAAAARAKRGVAAVIDAVVRGPRRFDDAETRSVETRVTAYDPAYATVEIFTSYDTKREAHGILDLDTYVIRRSTGARLTIGDFVTPAGLATITRVARRRLPVVLGSPGSFAPQLRGGTTPSVEHFRRITPLPEGLQVAFGTYQVASFGAGFPSVVVPWHDLGAALRLPSPEGPRDPRYRDGQLPYDRDRPAIVAAAGEPVERIQVTQWLSHRDWAFAQSASGLVVFHEVAYDPPAWRVVPCSTVPTGVRRSMLLRCP